MTNVVVKRASYCGTKTSQVNKQRHSDLMNTFPLLLASVISNIRAQKWRDIFRIAFMKWRDVANRERNVNVFSR